MSEQPASPDDLARLRHVRKAVAQEMAGRARLTRTTPVRVGGHGVGGHGGEAQVDVHEFRLPHPVCYAWIDAPDDGGSERIVIIRADDDIDSAERAVEVAIAAASGASEDAAERTSHRKS